MVVIGSLLLTALAWLLSGLKTLLVAVFSKYAVPLFVALAAFIHYMNPGYLYRLFMH